MVSMVVELLDEVEASMAVDQGQRILVVEDDKLFLWTLNCFLQKEGYTVVSANDAESAIDLVERQAFDVVISDFHLPGLDGKNLIRKVRVLQPNAKTILISAYQPEEIDNEDPALLTAYLNKPIELDNLKKLLREPA
jgi:CheY-like chemotaxis protein